jgi:hypothetical protein
MLGFYISHIQNMFAAQSINYSVAGGNSRAGDCAAEARVSSSGALL